ncbi:MAG TPA: deoxynucleoside kinase [Anaerolineales bacterium]|nr:deoxynucleoside kinase [Anaerolineales bacterium]
MAKKRMILVAGNIGAGKTTITEKLGERLGWETGFESVADNPYLPDFYANMAQWSFHLQVFFLGHRAEQHIEAANMHRSAILDRSIYEDFYIFTRALHKLGNMNERDYLSYKRVFELVVKGLPAPDLLVYLWAPVDVLIQRIRSRGRDIESGIDADYLSLLESFYDEWLHNFDLCPVLTIRSNDLNFAHNPADLETVIERINKALAGRDELTIN